MVGFKIFSVFSLAVIFTGCAVNTLPGERQEEMNWQSALYIDHPLVGSIWDVKNQQLISKEQLLERVESSRYLLLGEKHDNPDHHLLQTEVTNYVISQNKLALLSFEMMNSDKQMLLNEIHEQQELSQLETLKSYLQWDAEGWDWNFYGPLLQLAVLNEIPLAAANISNETMRAVYGGEPVGEAEEFLSPAVLEQLNTDIDESHCGMLPESQFPSMVRVQRARDESMARSLLNHSNSQDSAQNVSVLIAGNYHIRQDLGVPNYLLQANKSLQRSEIMALSFMEVNPAALSYSDYVESTGGKAAYDFVWFTPGISNEDYCASLRGEAN